MFLFLRVRKERLPPTPVTTPLNSVFFHHWKEALRLNMGTFTPDNSTGTAPSYASTSFSGEEQRALLKYYTHCSCYTKTFYIKAESSPLCFERCFVICICVIPSTMCPVTVKTWNSSNLICIVKRSVLLCNGSIGLNQSTTGFRELELASLVFLVKMTKENKILKDWRDHWLVNT